MENQLVSVMGKQVMGEENGLICAYQFYWLNSKHDQLQSAALKVGDEMIDSWPINQRKRIPEKDTLNLCTSKTKYNSSSWPGLARAKLTN